MIYLLEVGSITNPNFQGLDLVAADLIKQLVSHSSLTMDGVLLHVIFWNADTCISFLQGVSDKVMWGEYHRPTCVLVLLEMTDFGAQFRF
ncbi:hypothetical protein Tco_1035579 [Tanacetum coccineum]